MKILILHNRYKIVGGEEGVVSAEHALLEASGHTVQVFELSSDQITGAWGKVNAAISGIYSIDSKQKVSVAIAQFKPDIVHVHNFFPLLSPSIYDACLAANIPVVQTLHNYRLICPKAMPFRDGNVCEDCFDQTVPWAGVLHGCYRNSRLQSAAVAAMLGFHRLQGTWHQRVDAYIVLSAFQKRIFVQAGLPEDRFFIKPNFAFAHEPPKNSERENFALFVGRLAEEKGVSVLLDAYRQGHLTMPLKIVGDGPLRQTLEKQVAELPHVTFLGRQNAKVVAQMMQKAQFLVFPSIWYEGFPLTIAEAYACKLPVIASNLGTMSEIVLDEVTGLHFEAGNSTDLAHKMKWAIAHPETLTSMGESAHQIYQTHYTPEINYQQLIQIYKSVIKKSVIKKSAIEGLAPS
jgi:glycosyltransferase involved in cell wall biosynthesis